MTVLLAGGSFYIWLSLHVISQLDFVQKDYSAILKYVDVFSDLNLSLSYLKILTLLCKLHCYYLNRLLV